MARARIPPVKAVMTPFPHAVEDGATLDSARALMAEHGVNHLPVQRAHDLVGVLSHRDLADATEHGAAERVRDVMTTAVYRVDLDTPLDHVLTTMAEDHLGSVLVTRSGRLAGILTSQDVCRLFAEHLGRLRPDGDDVA